MEKKKENIEFIKEVSEKKSQQKNILKGMLDGSILTREGVLRQLPFIMFLTLLAFIYIGNRYHAEKMIRQSNDMHRELRDLRARTITTSANLMHISRQSEVMKLLRKHNIELEPSTEPPKKLIVRK